jgi:thiol:disulfide interchange protein DsbD
MAMQSIRALAWVAGLAMALSTGEAATTQAQLLLDSDTARPGDTVMAGVRLRMAPKWHTYWKNAGDAGGPTTIDWTLPAGLKAGEIRWPIPEKYLFQELTTYIYHDEAVLLVPLTLAADLPPGRLEIKAKVSWLECEDICVSGKTEVATTLLVGAETKPSKAAPAFEAWRKKLPEAKPASFAQAWWERAARDDTRPLLLEWTPGTETKEADFFPFGDDKFVVKAATEKVSPAPGKVRLRKVVEKLEGGWPAQVGGLLIEKAGDGKLLAAYEVSLLVSGGSLASGKRAARIEPGLLLANLVLAFLGGLILNLMPCVLPVIALKILGFVKQSGDSPARARQLGLVYALGVLVSMLALGGFVIAVQQAGKLASWGMQFQNPRFVVAITTLVTLVALNLFGVFEVTLGGVALGAAGQLAGKEGVSGAFFNGVLAVVLATPCTAPFLAPALGFAFAQPPAVIALFFASIAVGLALPYLVLSWFPAFLRFLPKPGAWMERFKIAMGFPMLGAAVWLFTIARSQLGKVDAFRFGMFLVALAFAAWLWGEFVQRGTTRRALARAISLLLGVGAAVYGVAGPADEIAWQPWSPAAVENARAAGRPVFVDFTADWCPNCKANKRTSIEIPSVRQKLKDIDAVTLIGDYTLEDPAIGAELQRFGRAGVPLVLVYPKDPTKPPIVLPALLTPKIVLDALDKTAQ